MARRKITDEERALLEQAMRAVKPLRKAKARVKKPAPAFPLPLAGEVAAKQPAAEPPTIDGSRPRPLGESRARVTRPPSPPAAAVPRKRGRKESLHAIDRRTDQKLKRGRVEIDATLDLHGLSQARAHTRLISFLTRASLEGSRTVLVITGKGAPRADSDGAIVQTGRGVLREAVPRWLEEAPVRDLVWAIRAAGPRQGGEGALYVLLKRPR